MMSYGLLTNNLELLFLPCIPKTAQDCFPSKFENPINKVNKSCFYAVKPCVVYNTRVMLPSVPTTLKSYVFYELLCRCKARYVESTTQRLADRIKEHVPTGIKDKSNTVRVQQPRVCNLVFVL